MNNSNWNNPLKRFLIIMTIENELAKLRYLERVANALFNDFIGLIGPDEDFPVQLTFRHCTQAEQVRTLAAIVEFKQALGKVGGEFTCAGSERTQTVQGLEDLG